MRHRRGQQCAAMLVPGTFVKLSRAELLPASPLDRDASVAAGQALVLAAAGSHIGVRPTGGFHAHVALWFSGDGRGWPDRAGRLFFGRHDLSAHAADEPDLIFKRSTVFKWLSPNDKLATYGLDDPDVEGVACHFTVPEKRRLQGLDRRRRGGLRHFARLPADRPDPLQGQVRAGRGSIPPAPLAVLQEDADRARLRREAQRAGLHGLFRPADRRLAEELDLDVPIMPWGAERARSPNAPNGWLRSERVGASISVSKASRSQLYRSHSIAMRSVQPLPRQSGALAGTAPVSSSRVDLAERQRVSEVLSAAIRRGHGFAAASHRSPGSGRSHSRRYCRR